MKKTKVISDVESTRRVISSFVKSVPVLVLSSVLSVPAVQALPPVPSVQTGAFTSMGSRIDNPSPEVANTSFRPPRNPRPAGSRTTTGRRSGGCLGDQESLFAMLGPNSVMGQTSLGHPEFVWYLPPVESPVEPPVEPPIESSSEPVSTGALPVTFRLLALNEANIPAPIHTAQLAYTPGYMTYQLPDSVPALVGGQEYRWQVIIDCDPSSPSRAIALELSLERVAASASLMQMLSAITSPAESAVAYGEAGLWYDAIAPVARARTAEERAVRTDLLCSLAASESTASWQQSILDIASSTADE